MESLLSQIRETHQQQKDVYESQIAELREEIEHLQSCLDATEIADKLVAYKSHADAMNVSVGEWVIHTLENAVKFHNIPVSQKIYARLCSLSGARTISLARLCQSDKMTNLIDQALNNGRL